MNDKHASSTVAIDAAAIMHAARKLEQGGLVAFPTETVYGLGGDAENPAAVAPSMRPRAVRPIIR
jgi:L-threonylcarbamoyladenylate synthase